MASHWTDLPAQRPGSGAGSCSGGAAAAVQLCAASGAAAGRRTSVADTVPQSWRAGAESVE